MVLPLTLALAPQRATLLPGDPAEIPEEWWLAPPTTTPTIIIIVVLPTKPRLLACLVAREAPPLQYRSIYRQRTSKCFLTAAQARKEVQVSSNRRNIPETWVGLFLRLIMNYPPPEPLRDESYPLLINHHQLHCSKVTIIG